MHQKLKVMKQALRKHNGNPYKRDGFAMIELMIALGVMVTVLVLIGGSIISIMAVDRVAEGREQAATYLATVMEEVRHAKYEELLAYTPDKPEGLIGAAVTVECFDKEGRTISLPLQNENLREQLPNPLRIQATLTFTTTGGHVVSAKASALHVR